jgi:hypothetical protein
MSRIKTTYGGTTAQVRTTAVAERLAFTRKNARLATGGWLAGGVAF